MTPSDPRPGNAGLGTDGRGRGGLHRAGSIARWIGIGLAVLLALIVGLFIEYHLPSTVVAQISDTMNRIDRGAAAAGAERSEADRLFIFARTRDGEVQQFRNEDSWLYLKFDSMSVQSVASSALADRQEPATGEDVPAGVRPGGWVLISYYGWRIPILSAYPNIIEIEPVDRDYTHVPVNNILILLVLGAIIAFIVLRVRRYLARRRHARLSDASTTFR